MARFRGTVQGNRGEGARTGTEASGLTVRANAAQVGVRVVAFVDEEGRDAFRVYATGGSDRALMPNALICVVTGGNIHNPNGEVSHAVFVQQEYFDVCWHIKDGVAP